MTVEPDNTASLSRGSILVALISLLMLGIFWLLSVTVGGTGIQVGFLLVQAVVISLLIWQACDPFAGAAQYIGRLFHLPGSVRGATLDAIASSMPELFSGIFFVVVAIAAAGDAEDLAEAGGEGFGATIATCAGSAVYNMILIPAICAIVISFYRRHRPTIDVDDKVISRDGIWFLGCELVLIVFLFQNAMHWWMGVALLMLYIGYVVALVRDARQFRNAIDQVKARMADGETANQAIDAMRAEGIRISRDLADRLDDSDDDLNAGDSAGVFFGMWEISLSPGRAWMIIGVATIIAASACYWLVTVTNQTADVLNIPVFFVAVILAAAASSVPDTFLSIGASMRGDDDGAVSNAFGSNIFDISICLTIPLFVGSYLNGWQPIQMTQDGEPMPGLVGLRIMLCSLTVITLLIMWHNRQLTRNKAFVLCGLYLLFVGYAVAGSLGMHI